MVRPKETWARCKQKHGCTWLWIYSPLQTPLPFRPVFDKIKVHLQHTFIEYVIEHCYSRVSLHAIHGATKTPHTQDVNFGPQHTQLLFQSSSNQDDYSLPSQKLWQNRWLTMRDLAEAYWHILIHPIPPKDPASLLSKQVVDILMHVTRCCMNCQQFWLINATIMRINNTNNNGNTNNDIITIIIIVRPN